MLYPDELEDLARICVDCGFQIHTQIGPGLLESAYEALMAEALRQSGLAVKRQVPVPLVYKGVVVDNAFKIDLLVEESLIIELKSVEKIAPVHGKQVMTYLRLTDLRLGLLMNFGQALFKDGVRHVVNDHRGGRYGD